MVSAKTESKPSGPKTMVSGGNRQFWLLLWIEMTVTEDPELFVQEEQAKKRCLKLYRDRVFEVKVYQCAVDSRGAEIKEVDADWYPDVKEG